MRSVLSALLLTVCLAACSDQDKPPATASPGPDNTPAAGPSGGIGPATTPAPSEGGSGFILNEVRFAATPGAPAFVELKNTDTARSSPSGLVLAGSATFPMPADAPEVEPGGVLVIVFDGNDATTGNVLHALDSAFPGAAGEISIGLRDSEVDQLRWVDAGAAAGGLVTTTPTPGWAAARPPSATARSAPWALVVPAGATPGAANAAAGVSLFGSDDRAIYSRPTVSLSWYSVPGATAYRLELASDAAFSTKVVDRTEDAVSPGGLSQESAEVGPLGAGRYYWRVTTVYNGVAAAVSAEQSFYIEPGGSAAVAGLGVVAAPVSLAAAAAAPVQLPVPHLFQRKDTAMLHLDNPAEGGARAWDKPDPAGSHNRPYCVRAVVAMVNHYYRGNLSLDRVGYEAFKDLRPGPELDLKESGADLDSLGRVASWALGVTVAEVFLGTNEDAFIAAVRAEIDAKRPVFLVRTGHVVLVVGYATDDGHGNFGLVIQDGNQAAWVVSSWPDSRFVDRYAFYLTIPDGAAGTQQEAGITRDGDGDGVVDFDESERFGLSSGAKDSDGDELDDKDDIRAGTWDERHGYARRGPGRDFDRDGIPMERDPDADDGGCFDGMEDVNGDGKFDAGVEIDNFEPGDDPCVGGTYLLVLEQFVVGEGSSTHTLQNSRATISLLPSADGTLTGRALVTYFLEAQTTNDDPTCPFIEIPRVTITGVSELTSELVAGKLQITANPEQGPPFTTTTVGCGVSESSDFDGTVWFAGWGLIEFTNGRYDYRLDYPLGEGATGEFYIEVHLRQPDS